MKVELLNIVLDNKAPITGLCNQCMTPLKKADIETVGDKELVELILKSTYYSIAILVCGEGHKYYVLKYKKRIKRMMFRYRYPKGQRKYKVVLLPIEKESKARLILKKFLNFVPPRREEKVVHIELSGSERLVKPKKTSPSDTGKNEEE